MKGRFIISTEKNIAGSPWYIVLFRHFPVRTLLIDMAIPILCYSVLANYEKPLAGIFFAGVWSIMRAVWESVRHKKVSIFALMTIVFTVIEFIMFYVSSSLYWLSLAIRSEIYGILVMATLAFKKTFIEIMVEESKTTNFTEEFKETKYYRNCWRLVTAAWGITYIAKGLFYLYVAPELDIGLAFTIRAILGWPLDIILIAFSIQFPHKYWHREYEKGNITMPIIKEK